jgi:hypothetical protein
MTRPSRRAVVLGATGAIVAVALGVALAGAARGIALYAYVLALVAVAVASLSSRLARAWPTTAPFERLLPARPAPEARVPQLGSLVDPLSGGDPSAFDLHHRLRPLIREIAAARLARGHGIVLESQPVRAQALVGPRTWELVRPDRPAPLDRLERPWSAQDLDELIAELERL